MTMISIQEQMRTTGQHAKQAARAMLKATGSQKAAALLAMAQALQDSRAELKEANERDLSAAQLKGLETPLLDRLKLSDRSLELMSQGLEQIARMPDPVGSMTASTIRPNGMRVGQMRVPLGVIGIIYESRPNVTIDAAALCLKSGNAAILRGGSEALHSNTALGKIVHRGLFEAGLPPQAVQVIETADRQAVGELITMTEYVDVIIPRGGKSLISRLAEQARVPMIKHLDGNCHVYIDRHADLSKASDIAFNAKTYRYGVCGAMETLLVHEALAANLLPSLAERFRAHGVSLRVCERTRAFIPQAELATTEDWGCEYLAPILAVKLVDSIDDAINHIALFGSGHTDSIVTEHLGMAQQFQREVDSSSVYINLPTCFADGFEYGLGAEIGISTNRLHARGPVGLEGLTTLKWVLEGDGQLRG